MKDFLLFETKLKMNSDHGSIHCEQSELQAVRPSQVPRIFQSGLFFRSLETTDDSEILVPNNVLMTSKITECREIPQLLMCLVYWGVSELPDEIFDLVLIKNSGALDESVVTKFHLIFPVLTYLKQMQIVPRAQRMDRALRLGALEIVQFLYRHGIPFSNESCEAAASGDSLSCLQFAVTHGALCTDNTFATACVMGNASIIQYLHENKLCKPQWDKWWRFAQMGQFDCLKYAIDQGFSPSR